MLGSRCAGRLHVDAFDRHIEVGITALRQPLLSSKLAATIARASEFPFIKLITPDNVVDFSEAQKVSFLRCSRTARKPDDRRVVNNIEHLLDRAPVGPHFSNAVLQSLTVFMAERPPKGRRLLIATISLHLILTDFGLTSFDAESRVAPITDPAVFDRAIEVAELFHSTCDRGHAVSMPRQASIGTEDAWLRIGICSVLLRWHDRIPRPS
ncbi:hypothetical protein EDB86DRAFT_3088525 [Lactarius hatsudake]|nr:hypothetical protein EDB86DRAFT_3088525 [Lactarius hatsudake]